MKKAILGLLCCALLLLTLPSMREYNEPILYRAPIEDSPIEQD